MVTKNKITILFLVLFGVALSASQLVVRFDTSNTRNLNNTLQFVPSRDMLKGFFDSSNDLSQWHHFQNQKFEFKYPPTWKVEEVQESSENSTGSNVVRVISPNSPRFHQVVGSTSFWINISSLDDSGLGRSLVFKEADKWNTRRDVRSELLQFQKNRNDIFFFYNIENRQDFMAAIVTENDIAFELLLSPLFEKSPTVDDLETLRGILSTFKIYH